MNSGDKSGGIGVAPRDGIEQVRELLFGAQFQELERKLARLEGRLGGDVDEVRKEVARRLSDLEAYVRGEVEALTSRLDDERNARLQAAAQQAKDARETLGNLEAQTHRLDDASSRGLRDLRRQLLDQSKTLLEELGRTREELSAMLDPDRSRESAPGVSTRQMEESSAAAEEPARASTH